MIKKIDSTSFVGHGPIKMLYPGLTAAEMDSGIGSIGRIDHAEFHGNTVIKMHPHINDEILSYFRKGKAEHTDSEGFEKTIDNKTLMLMKAGRSFFHEEKIIGTPEPLEGLQIFIRPGQANLDPEVVFMDLDEIHSENKWRLLASPGPETTFQFSSQTWLYDMKLLADFNAQLPELARPGLTGVLYVFNGKVVVNQTIALNKREALVIRDEPVLIETQDTDAELVLFVTDESAQAFKDGMYSGNKA